MGELVRHSKGERSPAIVEKEEKIDLKVPEHFTGDDYVACQHCAEVFYRQAHCVTCKQDPGNGMEVVYSPLVGSLWILASDRSIFWKPGELLKEHPME